MLHQKRLGESRGGGVKGGSACLASLCVNAPRTSGSVRRGSRIVVSKGGDGARAW